MAQEMKENSLVMNGLTEVLLVSRSGFSRIRAQSRMVSLSLAVLVTSRPDWSPGGFLAPRLPGGTGLLRYWYIADMN